MYAVRMGGIRNSCGKCSLRIRREDTVDTSLARDKIIHQCFSTFLPWSKPAYNFLYPKGSLLTKNFRRPETHDRGKRSAIIVKLLLRNFICGNLLYTYEDIYRVRQKKCIHNLTKENSTLYNRLL